MVAGTLFSEITAYNLGIRFAVYTQCWESTEAPAGNAISEPATVSGLCQ